MGHDLKNNYSNTTQENINKMSQINPIWDKRGEQVGCVYTHHACQF